MPLAEFKLAIPGSGRQQILALDGLTIGIGINNTILVNILIFNKYINKYK
jgi:hypothetical protein